MIGTERFLLDRKRSLVQRLGLGEAALVEIEAGQAAQCVGDLRMVGTQRFLLDRQRSLVQRLGVGEAALVPIEEG